MVPVSIDMAKRKNYKTISVVRAKAAASKSEPPRRRLRAKLSRGKGHYRSAVLELPKAKTSDNRGLHFLQPGVQSSQRVQPSCGWENRRSRPIRDRQEFRKTDSPRTLSQFPFCSHWDEFLADLFNQWGGTGRNLSIEIKC